MRKDSHEFTYTDDEFIEKNDKEKQPTESNDNEAPGTEIETVSLIKFLELLKLYWNCYNSGKIHYGWI